MGAGEDWEELLSVAGSEPIWKGAVPVTVEKVRYAFWWRVWETARMDLGWTAGAGAEDARLATLLWGTVRELVVPSFEPGASFTLEVKGVHEAMPGRHTTKAVVRVGNGRELEPLMNAVQRFATEMRRGRL
jgi:hypothetical protein